MARIKNVTDNVLTIPKWNVTAQPGEIVDVPDAKPFKDSDLWQVTTTKKSTDSEES